MGRFDYPSPYWDSVGDPALDLIDRMLTVDVDKRITIDECLEHPWLTGKDFAIGTDKALAVTDSTDGLTGALGQLDFSKRKVERERTLLSSLNTVKVSQVIKLEDRKASVKVYEKNADVKAKMDAHDAAPVNGKGERKDETAKKTGKEAEPAAGQQPQIFMEMGGRGDEQLFGNDRGSRYEPTGLL